MALKLVKKTPEYKIFVRGDDRYAVQDANGKPVNGQAKVDILLAESLIKLSAAAEPDEAPAEEAEEAAAEGEEGGSEEATEETTDDA